MLKYLLQAGVVALSTQLIAGDQVGQRCIIHIALIAALAFILIDKFLPKLTEGLSLAPGYYSPSQERAITSN